MLIKSKRKLKSQSSLHTLVFGKRIDFIAPFPLEECASRLAAKSEPRRWFSWSNPVTVSINAKEDDHYGFRLHKDAGRNLHVWILGNLERIDDDSTLVTGHPMISPLTYFFILLAIPLSFSIFQLNPFFTGIPWIIFPVILIGSFWIASAAVRDSLIRVVYNTLSDEFI